MVRLRSVRRRRRWGRGLGAGAGQDEWLWTARLAASAGCRGYAQWGEGRLTDTADATAETRGIGRRTAPEATLHARSRRLRSSDEDRDALPRRMEPRH